MGTRNTLGDLNNHLFEQMERLNSDDLKGYELQEEIDKSRAISGIAKDIISNANLVLQVQKFVDDKNNIDEKTPKMLEG